jgi:hypothetical protein
MRFYTKAECEDWLAGRGREIPEPHPDLHFERFLYPKEPYRVYPFARLISDSFNYREPVLLWITEWGIWPSSENGHLYYKVRQSYGDRLLLHERPGHLFLGYESEDLASFLQLAMLNGWGGHFITAANYTNAFFSHDGYIDFFSNSAGDLDDIRKFFSK